MNGHVLLAIFKRNFVSYFSNPTGYVFICVFVLLSGIAAFWPNEFFNANLCNLDQLNKYLPYIMLVFIPAITMSVWAEERRLGTDELLLTMPATDLEVVLGKYLAAVAIYTSALVFSGVSNFVVLRFLGAPDIGLLAGMYFGYWMVGAAMLSIGMVASFLTTNLTVGFVLGALFNAPLAFIGHADVIFPPALATSIKRWSIGSQFSDFGRGVISLSSVCYFVMITVVMLYLCVVLIGRRHWWGGRDGHSYLGHYIVRAVALAIVAVCLTIVFTHSDLRVDVTSERIASLSPQTKTLIKNLDPPQKVIVDAFISPQVPEAYVQTRANLLNTLEELKAMGGNKLDVRIHDTESFSEEASIAEEQYDIGGQEVVARNRGATVQEQIYLGVAFSCGLDKVIVPFVDRGIPVEYEMVRSIATVAGSGDRRKVGVLETDAQLYGRFNMQSMSSTANEQIIQELQKQYDVVRVNADNPITEKYDVLLAVQPSSLTQPQMDHFMAAIRSGQPTAIFEDPFPYIDRGVPGTNEPKRPQGGMMGMGSPPPTPKGNVAALWNMLGVDFTGGEVIWQNYNPYPKLGDMFPKEFVFVREGSGEETPSFNRKSPITSDLEELLFLFPGAITREKDTGLDYTPLVFTGKKTGVVAQNEIMGFSPFGQTINQQRRLKPTNEEYVLAALIQGRLKPGQLMADEKAVAFHPGHEDGDDHDHGDSQDPEIKVLVVSDIDCLYSAFFSLRARGDDPEMDVNFNFDNVPFILNALDLLAGDERFIPIRNRSPQHKTLEAVEVAVGDARTEAGEKREEFIKQFEKSRDEAQAQFDKKIAEIRDMKNVSNTERAQMLSLAQNNEQRRLDSKIASLERQRDDESRKIEIKLAQRVRSIQDRYKFYAVAIPPIFPLLMGIAVFFRRRSQEREGVPESRMRHA